MKLKCTGLIHPNGEVDTKPTDAAEEDVCLIVPEQRRIRRGIWNTIGMRETFATHFRRWKFQ
jgi:hypothetical protein